MKNLQINNDAYSLFGFCLPVEYGKKNAKQSIYWKFFVQHIYK